MSWPASLRLFASALFRRSRVESEMDEELASHIRDRAADHVREGMSAGEAARKARLEFGGYQKFKEECREAAGVHFLETLAQDTRYAFRTLRKAPGFAAVAILTLAIGIGANTAIFSVVYAILLKPLPYAHSEQLFNVFQRESHDESVRTGFSYPNFSDLREQSHIFSDVAGVQRHELTLTGHGEPQVISTSVVTSDFFSVFCENPIVGRVFVPEEGKVGAPAVVILSEGLWRSSFGADPGVIGTSIDLDKRSFTIVGVVPTGFRFPSLTKSEQIWIPRSQDPLFGSWLARRGGHWLQVTGRLRPGISRSQAQAELSAFASRSAKDFPAENDGWEIGMIPLQQMIVGDVKSALLVLLGAVGLVLLIACTNIANLLLSRATSRAKEIALRATLGAGRARIIRQLLSETAVLSLLGGLAGIFLAYAGVRGLSSFLPATLPQVNEIRVDHFVLGFAFFLSAFAGAAVGLVPAFYMSNSSLQTGLREGGGRSGQSSGGRRARGFLAAAEIALAMVLLVTAGLLMRSFVALTAVNPGFQVQKIVKADISLPRAQYATPQQWNSFADNLLAGIKSEPGLQDSAVAIPMPLADGQVNLAFEIEGRPPVSAGSSLTADYVSVSPDYFHVMGIPLLGGRTFDQRDDFSSPRVTLINRAMARTYFPHQDPVGQRLVFGFPPDADAPREIVGIVGDVHDVSLGEDPGPMMYVPYAQAPFPGAGVVVKSTLSAASVTAAIRQEVAKHDKDLPVSDVAQMSKVIEESVAQPRFRTFLLALFAAIALALAAIGIFGVISYSVSCRRQEIGIRVALGASRRAILRMVLRETLFIAVAGLALGVPCALAASRLLGHLLFNVSPNDPLTLFAVALALVAIAVLAGYIPARRAMRTDPMIALRHE
ncbi:MAG TPA: ABC transporter permease [Candidatus Acidoferrales bacterium]